MPIIKLLPYPMLITGCIVACVLCVSGTSTVVVDYSKHSVAQLIDDLTEIDSPAPGIDSAGMFEGFIADDTPGKFRGGVLPVVPPKVPPQMSELVRRGPRALPELVKHLDDRRPTKLEVGNKDPGSSSGRVGVDAFMFSYFSEEYDPRVRQWLSDEELRNRPLNMGRNFQGRYTVKVGDVCYVLIGQIVNRRLLAARYQASGGLMVNSPIEAPVLAEKARNDWDHADAEMLKASLLADMRAANYPKHSGRDGYLEEIIDSALVRLRLYFPDSYNALEGDDLVKRNEFEEREQESRKPKQELKPYRS